MAPESYSMLSAETCHQPLPVAEVVDSFEYVRFAPIWIERDADDADAGSGGGSSGPQPAVYPIDHAMPEYVAAIRHREWLDRRQIFDRGGMPLIEAWTPFDPRSEGLEPERVEIDDVASFLARPLVPREGRDERLPIESLHVEELTRFGRTLVDGPGGRPFIVEMRRGATPLSSGAATPSAREPLAPVVAVDAATFVADPVVSLEGSALRARLSPEMVTSLLVHGEALVEVVAASAADRRRPRASETRLVRVVAASTGPAIGTTSAPMMTVAPSTAEAPRTVQPVESLRSAGQIHQAAPAPVKLPNFNFEIVFYLPYRQEWHLLGYARGELLNSIALAPEEETTIEVFSWDRRKIESEVSLTDEREFTYETKASRKETADAVNEVQRSNDWKTTAGGKIELPEYKGFKVGGELKSETGGDIKRTNKQSIEVIAEASAQASAKLKVTRQTKVTTTAEIGTETRVTRKIHNVNRCRTLTYDFFEVLASYRIETRPRPDGVRLAVLIADPFAQPINRDFVLAHYGTIKRALLDREHEAGLEAARRLAARMQWCLMGCQVKCRCRDSEGRTPGTGRTAPLGNGTSGGAGGGTPTRDASGRELAKAELDTAIAKVVAAIRNIREAGWSRLIRAMDTGAPGDEYADAVLEFRRFVYREFGLEMVNPGFWSACESYERDAGRPGGDMSGARLERLLTAADSAWIETLVRGVLLAHLQINILLVFGKKAWDEIRDFVKIARLTPEVGLDDAGLGTYLGTARTALERFNDAVESEIVLAPAKETKPTEVAPPAPPIEPVEPFPDEEMAVHQVALDGLVNHITMNSSHYRMAIWQAMSPTDRLARLGVFGNLGGLVEDEILGFVGDKVALPFQTAGFGGLQDVMDSIAAQLIDPDEVAVREVVLPTPGVDMRGRLGDCDLCEPFIAEHRELDTAERRAAVAAAEQKARAAELEADRHAARLALATPNLDPFDEPIPGG